MPQKKTQKMDLFELDTNITKLNNVVSAIYFHLVPDWQRNLDARRLADIMAKKNRKTAKSTAHHMLAGELIVSSKIHKTWRQKKPPKVLVPKNTPERMQKKKKEQNEQWAKLRSDVKLSIGRFEEKLMAVARERATDQLENLNI